MHDLSRIFVFPGVPLPVEGSQPVELARTLAVHPFTYQELPYDPEYSLYAGRLNPEKNIKSNTGRNVLESAARNYFPPYRRVSIRDLGPNALKLLNVFFPATFQRLRKGAVLPVRLLPRWRHDYGWHSVANRPRQVLVCTSRW
ncbi:MAG: hypothetical protein CM1200mP18_11640 [Gammaproteobacteria bacterium]|nr:MAG: hypothetical protein CM1200mP18_11640 [Gammaproteobacteria bacterium]